MGYSQRAFHIVVNPRSKTGNVRLLGAFPENLTPIGNLSPFVDNTWLDFPKQTPITEEEKTYAIFDLRDINHPLWIDSI